MPNRALLFILLLLTITSLPVRAQEAIPITPKVLLQRMVAAYSVVKSYEDTGSLSSSRESAHEQAWMTFRTYFRRPDGFRFDFHTRERLFGHLTMPEGMQILWSNSEGTYGWLGSHVETYRDVTMGVAGFTGISRRTVHHIPSLLQKNLCWQQRLDQIPSPVLVGEEVFEGTDCYHLQSFPVSLWLSKADYLVRKIEWAGSAGTIAEIHRDIQVEAEIPEKVFHFIPPQVND